MIVGCVPVRNEEWILERSLMTLSEICDVVIVVDDASTDRTPEICRKVARVRYFRNEKPQPAEVIRRQLLDIARSVASQAVLIYMDADEVLTAQAAEPEFKAVLRSLSPGQSLALPWIWLWKDPLLYRDDSHQFSDSWLPCIFRDDGVSAPRFTGIYHKDIHQGRIAFAPTTQQRRYTDVRVLHYQFVAWDRAMSKQAMRRIAESLSDARRSAAAINELYVVTRDERSMKRRAIAGHWIRRWLDMEANLLSISDEPFSWFDLEVLRAFARHGTARFADLDLWDIDWEAKRQMAKARGLLDIPPFTIRDPRSLEQRVHHAYIQKFFVAPFWHSPQVLLRPMRRLLRRIGLTRRRLRVDRITADMPW